MGVGLSNPRSFRQCAPRFVSINKHRRLRDFSDRLRVDSGYLQWLGVSISTLIDVQVVDKIGKGLTDCRQIDLLRVETTNNWVV